MQITLHNQKVISFLQTHNIDFEELFVELLPFVSYLLGEKGEYLPEIKNTLSQMFREYRKENKRMTEQYSSNMNYLVKLFEERDTFMKSVFESTIQQNTQALCSLLEQKDGNVAKNISEYTNRTCETMKQCMDHSQEQISSVIKEQNSSERFKNILYETNAKIMEQMQQQLLPLQTQITNITNQFQNSSKKGRVSEQRLDQILTQLFSSHAIQATGKEAHSGDFILQHHICGKVLIENKDYSENVGLQEIEKFLRDVSVQKCHGILMSQQTGIANKNHFHIEFNQGFVNIYLHKVNYNPEMIQDAFLVLESVQEYAANSGTEHTDLSLSEDQINAMYREFKELNENHHKVVLALKDQIKVLQTTCLPTLKSFFNLKFPHNSDTFVCQKCGKVCKNKGSLAQHVRFCQKEE